MGSIPLNSMSDFLFARPSFISGAMSVIDLFGVSNEYNYSLSTDDADRRALNADAMSIRYDFSKAYETSKKQCASK